MRGSFPLNGTYFQVNEVNLMLSVNFIFFPGHIVVTLHTPIGLCSNLMRTPNALWWEMKVVNRKLLSNCTAGGHSFLDRKLIRRVLTMQMFADHDSSLNPIDVPRAWIWNLPRRTVYFGTSVSTIFKGKIEKLMV